MTKTFNFVDKLKTKIWIQGTTDIFGTFTPSGDMLILVPDNHVNQILWESCQDYSESVGRLYSDRHVIRGYGFKSEKVTDPFSGMILGVQYRMLEVFTHTDFIAAMKEDPYGASVYFQGELIPNLHAFTATDPLAWPRNDLYIGNVDVINQKLLKAIGQPFPKDEHTCVEGQTPIIGFYPCKLCGRNLRPAGY